MDLARLYPERPPDARKGDFGRVVVAGGSERYTGAPALSALAALRAGADLAIVVAPRRAADVVATFAPDLITVPCDTPFPEPALVAGELARAQALVLGGGVERTDSAHAALRDVVRRASVPMVLDAEALHAIAADPAVLRGKRALLTPHGGEYRVVAGEPWPDAPDARREAVRAAAKRLGAAVIVKGATDVASDGARVEEDPESSPFLTKGGYGDLLAGVAGALLARGAGPLEAGLGAARIVGRAGRLAAEGAREGTLASDALRRIPDALAELTR